jgi:hypothetical protein
MAETVWVVYLDYGYEGCTEPQGVFSTKDKAEAFTKAPEQYWRSGEWVIEEYTVDES